MRTVVRLATRRGYRLWISVRDSRISKQHPTVILCHGLGVSSEYPFIQTLEASFVKAGYPVVTFDFAGHGKSGGRIKDRLVQNCMADLRDVMRSIHRRGSDAQGVILVGHSIGALAIILYAALYPKHIVALVPIASNAEAKAKQKRLEEQGKVRMLKNYSIVGRTKVSKDFWKDRVRFEPQKFVRRLKSPVLYLVGSKDRTNPPEESMLLKSWTKPKGSALHTIPGADHYFRPKTHQRRVVQVILPWLQKNIL